MVHLPLRLASIATLIAASLALNGCLISSSISTGAANGITTFSAAVSLTKQSPCVVDTVAQTTTCTPVIQLGLPTGTQTFPMHITLTGFAAPLTLYDPLIFQVPASMSNFAGSIVQGPPGSGQVNTPLSVISGLTSVPIDPTKNLVAEPGMQLVIVDFQAPENAPFGSYTLKLQFSGTTNSIKVMFALKVKNGALDYYVPIFPCEANFANVPALALPPTVAGFTTYINAYINSAQFCQGLTYNFSGGAPPPGPDMNQQGLTGSWYEPATDGQGIEVEVYPDFPTPGAGSAFLSWFTYDTVVGGAERQRWYVLAGPVVNGQPASLKIYQNTGGNFNAPPITSGKEVGTATLSFDSCTGGQLTYTFTDGSGRTGTIPLTRITQNVTCSTSAARPTDPDFALTGNWYNSATDGQGFTVELNPNNKSLFFTWYTYAPNGVGAGPAGQRWYVGSSKDTVAAGSRSIPVTIYETTGGAFDTPKSTAPTHSVAVGTGTLAFQSCKTATLNFTFTGGSSSGAAGTINLTRIGPVPQGCTPLGP